MNRNLITRMGTAGGVVAALVAAVFAVMVTTVRDQRSFTRQARASEQVIAAAQQRARSATTGERRRLDALVSRERASAGARRADADRKARLAIALGVGGLVGSAALIALLVAYLARYVVVPVRRTARAANRLAAGDLAARVAEEGDAESVALARAFNTMAAELQAADRLRDELIALVSHELRTPLTSILGYVELLRSDEDALSEDARRFLEIVERNARRLLRLVGDMLFVAQVQAGGLELERGELDLATVAVEAVDAARPAADRAGVELALRAEPTRHVLGDRDRCGQLLDNLVSNALKFTPPGGRVEVRLRDAEDRAVIEVSDTGEGIPAGEQERLFERFFRSSAAASQAAPGAGLGLAVVKTIVDAHDGSVEISSREGEGTTVRVELPYERTAAVR